MSIATEKKIIVDYKQPREVKVITFLQYDTNIIKIIVEDNGEIADLSNITKIMVNFLRPDQKVISQELAATNNEIIYRLTDSEMLKAGDCYAALQLFGDDERLTVAKFKVVISESIESGEPPTVEEIRLVEQLIETVNEKLQELSELGTGAQGNSLPSYWESHLTSKINRIVSLQDEDGINRHSIGFITDMHLEGNNEKHSGKLMGIVDRECNLSLVINGGDMISHLNGAVSKTNALSQIKEGFNMFPDRVIDKMLYLNANHDDNSHSGQNWTNTFKDGEIYSQYFRHLDGKVVRGSSPRYYYLDDTFRNIRYIVLDSIDIPYIQNGNVPLYSGGSIHAFRQEQLTWFANVALNVPNSSWSVLVCSHMPPYGVGVAGYDRLTQNSEMARGILGAFKDKTTYSASSLQNVTSDFIATVSVDFTNKGGEVICWITGHTHNDNIVTMPESEIKLVTTMNDHKNRFYPAPQGIAGTISEQAFDVLTIDRTNKNIYLTRIGAGADRQFSYLPSQPIELGRIIFEDNFTRVNSPTLGANWITQRGQFRIEGNAARPQHNIGTSISLYAQNAIQNNVIIESALQPIVSTEMGVGLVVRYLDDNNHIRVMLEANKVILVLVDNDIKTTLAEKNLSYSGAERFVIRIEMIDTEIKVFVNNILELTGNSTNFIDTARCGIRSWSTVDDSTSHYNFSIRQIS